MNIKNIVHYITPEVFKREKTKNKNSLRSEMLPDRDSQGRQSFSENHKKSLNEEEFEQALKELGERVKEKGLMAMASRVGQRRFAIILNQDGRVLCKIPDYDLWSLISNEEEKAKGLLINKSA